MYIYLERNGNLILNISTFVKENNWEPDLYRTQDITHQDVEIYRKNGNKDFSS